MYECMPWQARVLGGCIWCLDLVKFSSEEKKKFFLVYCGN